MIGHFMPVFTGIFVFCGSYITRINQVYTCIIYLNLGNIDFHDQSMFSCWKRARSMTHKRIYIVTVTRAKQRINMCISVWRCNFIDECMLKTPVIRLNFSSSKGWLKVIGVLWKNISVPWNQCIFYVKGQSRNTPIDDFNVLPERKPNTRMNMLIWLLLLSTRVRENFSVSCFTLDISTWIDLFHVTTLNNIYLFGDILGKR